MLKPALKSTLSVAEIERMSSGEVAQLMQSKDASIDELKQQVDALTRRVDWFTRQHFGSRSERFTILPVPAVTCCG